MNFFEQVYEQVKRIPKGKVATYGQIATLCGNLRASRAVGYALHVNPQPHIIPCHRVVNRSGYLSGGFAFGGIEVQKQLLEAEGVAVAPSYSVDLALYLWQD
ncbi:MAG: MGMT family protein [Hyphomonadaceae bacterium]|nr:MGMT family protein [Clostridia bacterium]